MLAGERTELEQTSFLSDHARMHRVLEGLLEISNFVGSVMLLDDILDRIVRSPDG